MPTLEQLVPLPHPNPVLVWDTWQHWKKRSFHRMLWKKLLVLWPSSPRSQAVEWDLDIRTMVEDLKSLGSRGAFGVVTLWNVCEIQ